MTTPDQQTTLPHLEALEAVRRRGSFLTIALIWAIVATVGITGIGYFFVVANAALDAADRVRQGVGIQPPTTGADWYLVAVISVLILAPLGLIGWIGLWYRRVWRGRLKQTWPRRADMKRHAGIRPLRATANERDVRRRAAYLDALLATPGWTTSAQTSPTATMHDPSQSYRTLAEQVLGEIEEDVAERAIATGLIIGLGSSRLDRATIIAAALEMQLHVLSRLGKRPTLGTWKEIVQRTSASLFFNTYLNREDAFAISFAIRRMAIGLDLAGDLVQDAADSLASDDPDGGPASEVIEEGVEAVSGLADTAGMLAGGIPIGGIVRPLLGVSASGFEAAADVTRGAGDELLQGALAGGVLYFHGMAIAADVLALDQAHRNSEHMTRTPMDGASRTAVVAGRLLKEQARRYRSAYSERQRAPFTAARNKIFHRRKRTQPPPTVTLASPNELEASPSDSPSRPWGRLRRSPKNSDAEPDDASPQ